MSNDNPDFVYHSLEIDRIGRVHVCTYKRDESFQQVDKRYVDSDRLTDLIHQVTEHTETSDLDGEFKTEAMFELEAELAACLEIVRTYHKYLVFKDSKGR